MLDSNGSNTTAVAAVAKLQQAAGSLQGRRAIITAGSGPVGTRAGGLMAKAGADVTITTRRTTGGTVAAQIQQRFGGTVHELTMVDASGAAKALEGAELLLNAGAASVCMVPKDAWMGRSSLKAAADINAVPPLGIEGIDVMDNAADRNGVVTFGALGVGNLKMKIHKACIARLFEKNDQVLDVEAIAEIARELSAPRS
jgi:NAD(P)-dependent dehydrogenase (short-subunit alcohol dehydrogenase family)